MSDSLKNAVGKWKTQSEAQNPQWTGTLGEYIEELKKNPRAAQNAFQRMYQMIISKGTENYIELKKNMTRYKFFEDADNGGKDAVFGLDESLMKLVNILKAASLGYGPEKRVILLHGPVGSAKSTICRMLKKGLESYSRSAEGALYTFEWINLKSHVGLVSTDDKNDSYPSPMNEEPLLLLPENVRNTVIEDINKGQEPGFRLKVEGELSPPSRHIFKHLMNAYNNDLEKVIQHIRVKRLLFSEADRVGIGTFQPKDEKNQDSTELTGDLNYRKIAEYGSDSDPRAFNFDGEFNVANRGVIEFVEVLKLDVAFLYDLLGASQEHRIKPKKFAQTHIDEVIIGHTNEPEYRRLQDNEYMEALRDRTVRIDIPYITKLEHEINIYKRDFNKKYVPGISIAPHTVEMAAMWAILTRLDKSKKHDLHRLQKLKLYNGKTLHNYSEDNIKELKDDTKREGFQGISPRYIQDKISNVLVMASQENKGSVNPFMMMNELEAGLKNHSLIVDEATKQDYLELLAVVKGEYEELIKGEVRRAISSDDGALTRLCNNYIDSVKAFTQKEKIKNPFTGANDDPDEKLMRSIEEKIDVPESRKADFRVELMNFIASKALEGKQFNFKMNERLHSALEDKMFEDSKDSIKLTSIMSSNVDKDTQEKIEVVKSRLIKNFGYDEISANDVLSYVASIFSRGDTKK